LPNVTDRRHSTQSAPVPPEWTTPSEESEEVEDELSTEARLLQKLAHWLIAQPEYPAIFLDNRKTRRDFARKAATIIATIPKVRVK
jgi:hypothetical protein